MAMLAHRATMFKRRFAGSKCRSENVRKPAAQSQRYASDFLTSFTHSPDYRLSLNHASILFHAS
jgi:hypothetical protein